MAHFCEHCGRDFTNPRCPRCGGPPQSENIEHEEHGPEPVVLNPAVSDPDDRLDHMIEQASLPTLASLLKRGIERGLIKPAHDYAGGGPAAT